MPPSPEHPDYPIDPTTGQPALPPEDLETGELQAIQPGMDFGTVFKMKEALGPLDDSDEEALETYRRFSP